MAITRVSGVSLVPGLSLSVYLEDTTEPATIYADSLLTPLGNPFTVDGVSGLFAFYADDAVAYDLVLSNGSTPIIDED